MKNAIITTAGASMVALVLIIVAAPVYGGTFQLYSVRGFVESLIERGIISESMADKAREIAAAVSAVDSVQADATPYRDVIDVSVSQLIQYASRTYKAGSDINGLVLLAMNTHTEDVYPTAKRGCQVVYRIYHDDALLYDSASTNVCDTDEVVSYRLGPGQTRMFEVSHKATAYPLEPGEYTFVLDYPGYGDGSRSVTVE